MKRFSISGNRLRIASIVTSLFGFALCAQAAAPTVGDDDLTAPVVNQNALKTITLASLTGNDEAGGAITAVDATSAKGAAVAFGASIIYNPALVTEFIALDSSDPAVDDTFDYTYTRAASTPTTNTGTVTVSVQGVNDAPTLTGVSGTVNINDNATTTPFSSANVDDVDIENVTVTVTVGTASEGVMTNLNGFSDVGGGVYTYTGSQGNAQTKLRGLVFDPTENRLLPELSDTTAITAVVSDGDASSATRTRTVNVTSINDVPTLANLGGTVSIDDDETTTPFTAGTITDDDHSASITVTVTVAATDTGTMTNLGSFANPSTGTYTFTGTPTAATTALTGLVFTPANNRMTPGLDENTTLTVTIDDSIITTTLPSDTRTVNVTSINDAPVLAPNGPFGPFNLAAGTTIKPFIAINSLIDDDYEDLTPPVDIGDPPAGDDFTATITLAASPFGTLISDDFSGSGGTYTFTSKRVQVEAAIKNVLYQAPSSDQTFTLTLSVADSHTGTSNSVIATVIVSQPNPGITGLVTSGQQLADDDVIFPFAAVTFSGFGDDSRLVEVTLDDDLKGEFQNLGVFSKSAGAAPYTYSMTGSSAEATTAIRNLRFSPTPNRITGASETVSMTITVKDSGGTSTLFTSTPVVVTVFPTNDSPIINSTSPIKYINNDETETPFASISVTDLDAGGTQPIILNITLIGAHPAESYPVAGGGIFSEAVASGIFTTTGTYPNVTYTLAGTPAAVTSALQALVFTPGNPPPASDRWPVGQSESVAITLSVADYFTAGSPPTNPAGGTDLDSDTQVNVTYVNGAPFINGVPPLSQQPFPVAGSADTLGVISTEPFKSLSVSDDDAMITFSITLDDEAKGILKNLGGFVDSGSGVYTMADATPADIQTDLRALVFEVSDTFSFPSNTPGLTTFTLSATDPAPNNRTIDFTIFVREQNVSHIVSVAGDNASGAPLIAGSLREALSFAGVNDAIVFEFPAADYPVTIHLERPISIEKNLKIVGSGVEQLTISGDTDDDGVGDTSLFIVNQDVEFNVEQLTLKYGFASSYGGAIAADMGSRVIARDCSFEKNSAGQFGGAIDVFEGELLVEGCLFFENSVVGSTAKGGGAISIYSTIDSTIRNSTFVGNLQGNLGGDGGAAISAQNSLVSDFFNLLVEHCTFSGNVDAKSSGSAILSSRSGTAVNVRNNIFADDAGLAGVVLDVLGAGDFVSLGGNIATDSTETTYTQGGSSQNILLLDPILDSLSKTAGEIGLRPLADNGGTTLTMALDVGSIAIDTAAAVAPIEDATGVDQRGVWRDANPDVGAYEAGIFKRVMINEIYVQGASGVDFIEFYNPRDSQILDMVDLELRVDGALKHTFLAQTLIPGAGFAWTATFDLEEEKGNLELWNSDGQVILFLDYIGGFSEFGSELDITGQSITRYPNFEGGLLPHQRIVTQVTGSAGGGLTSPGNDVTGAPLNGGNAPPIAVVDIDEAGLPLYYITASETLRPDLLSNDIEFDRADIIKITEVSEITTGSTINQELFLLNGSGSIPFADLPLADVDTTDTTFGSEQAVLTIDADDLGLLYDPTGSDDFIGLALGETATDVWAYTILDYDAASPTTQRARGANATEQEDNIVRATAYFAVIVTGVNENPETGDDFAATAENRALRLLGDSDLLTAGFIFGDLPADYMDYDATGALVPLPPLAPTVALIDNDSDADSDDDEKSLLIVGVHQTAVKGTSLIAFSEKGATVSLDLRADRRETSVIYDPRASPELNKLSDGETTTDTFYYTILDQHGADAVGTVIITVIGVNDAPIAIDDFGYSVSEDDTLEIAENVLLENDSDVDMDGTGPDDILEIDPTLFPITSVEGATVTFDGTTITYDPAMMPGFESLARNETLADSFQYTLIDTFGTTRVATVSLVVAGQNDTPVAEDGIQLDIFENDTTTVPAVTGLLENLGDIEIDINGSTPDDDPWVIPQRDFTTPLGATLDINSDGSYRYDANSDAIDALIEGELAMEDFDYTVTDNSRTRAIDDLYKVEANRTDVTLPVLSNDAVVGSVPIGIVAYSEDLGDANVTIIESIDHALRDGLLVRIEGYAGAAAYNGVYPVTSIDVDHFSIPVAFDAGDLTTGGTWQPWFNITAVSATDNGGTISITEGQSILYTPMTNFFGAETFTYTIEDGAGGQDVAIVTIENILSPFNGTLHANSDIFSIGIDAVGVEIDVLANDNVLPALGSVLTITEVTPVGSGVTIINGGKALSYDAAGVATTEVFTYTVSGGGSVTTTATVTFEVEDRTDQLSGNDDSYFVVTGSTNVLLDVLANDEDLPSFPVSLTLESVQYTGTGSATVSGNSIDYTPPPFPFQSTDTFMYTARDGSGATTTQIVQVDVVADSPDFRAQADHYRVVAGSGPILLSVLSNDGTIQNLGATVRIENLGLDTAAPPDFSRVMIDASLASIAYTPPTSATTEIFNYEIGIGTIERREATITIEVVDSFDMEPEAEHDFYSVARDSGPHTLNVLANDLPYPLAGWSWTIVSTTLPDEEGTLDINGGTALTYTPALDFFGTETFTYTIEDVFGAQSTASVTVQVGELITCLDVFVVLEGSADNPLQVLANDDLLNRYASDYEIVLPLSTPDQLGTVSIDGSGFNNQLLYTPDTGFVGEETFSYTVVDISGNATTAEVTVIVVAALSDRDDAFLRVKVTGINDIPMLSGTTTGAGITDKQTIQPFATVLITDLDASIGGVFAEQPQNVSVTFDPAYGTVSAPAMTMNGSGDYSISGTPAEVTAALRAIVFTPTENVIDYINPAFFDLEFDLSINDGYTGGLVEDTTTVRITPENDIPTLVSFIADQFMQVNDLPRGILLTPYFADVDDDIAAGELVWTVSGNTNSAIFDSVTVDAAKQSLVISLAADVFGVADITVRGTDRGGLFVEDTFTVTVDGPPVIELEPGQDNPDSPSYVNGTQDGVTRDYRHSFRVTNEGVLPAQAFIVHITDLDQPINGVSLVSAEYSTDENTTPTNFNDDTRSSVGVSILLEVEFETYSVKYDRPLQPGESTVVHLTYRVATLDQLNNIRPNIRIELTVATPTLATESPIITVPNPETGEVAVTFAIQAGGTYQIESSPDLTVWTPWTLVIPVSDFDSEITIMDDGLYTDPHPSFADQRFYRLVEIPTP